MAEESNIPSVKNSKSPIYISLGVIAVLVGIYFFSPAVQEFLKEAWEVLTSGEEEQIEEWVSRFGMFGPLLIVVGKIAQLFLIVIPTIAMVVVAILAYGSIWGPLIVVVAVFAAASVAYFLGAYFGPVILEKTVGGKTQKLIMGLIKDYGFWGVVIIRVNPLFSSDAISFAAGVMKMRYWKFISATIVGITPLAIFIALLGRNYEQLLTGLIWASVVGIFLFILYVWLDKKRKKQKKQD